MRQGFIFIALIILVVVPAAGQKPRRGFEIGTAADLKGRTKVFVGSTPQDKSLSKKVIATIEAKLPGVTLVNSLDEAEILVRFFSTSWDQATRTPPDLNNAPRLLENGQTLPGDGQTRFNTEHGTALYGTVAVIQRPGNLKLVMQFSKKSGTKSSMAERFANEFVRIYQEATGSP